MTNPAPTIQHDFDDLVCEVRRFAHFPGGPLRNLFQQNSPIHIARAPGRLDVMGGIGDYSGSLVLELPIAEAAFAAVQLTSDCNVTIATLRDERERPLHTATIIATDWNTLKSNDLPFAREFFRRNPACAWAGYMAGPALILLRKNKLSFDGGMRILIASQVPEGKGVSSSAAVEVATMRALATALNIELDGETLAHLCQVAENHVVGAPCGIMDQMTSALGRENELLALRCQPAIIEGFVKLPNDIALWGIDSGIRHAVSGSDYTSVRCGAFMGYRIIADAAGLRTADSSDGPGVVEITDDRWHGYLANITPAEFDEQFADAVPEHISGAEFLKRYQGTTDRVTRVDPNRTYGVRAPTLHPIHENARAERFRTLLENEMNDGAIRELGQLMSAAHDSYTACGLSSDGTDLLVDLVREAGSDRGLYGAKITGGGSGGTVAIIGRSDADSAVTAIARRYTDFTGRQTHIFRGSSPGAYSTPVQQLLI